MPSERLDAVFRTDDLKLPLLGTYVTSDAEPYDHKPNVPPAAYDFGLPLFAGLKTTPRFISADRIFPPRHLYSDLRQPVNP